jgi:hypothetical protein
MVGCAAGSHGRSEFASPEAASTSLVAALRADDRAKLRAMLGPETDRVLYSGDRIADRARMARFLAEYDRRHQLERSPDGSFVLAVGDQDWPLPIPIVEEDDGWVFATESGVDEMISRRVGQNELDAIQVTRAIVDAEREYAQRDLDQDGVADYAPKLMSDAGRRNGLFWPTTAGEEESPLGPLVAGASSEGYRPSTTGEPVPYHGYHYRVLTGQGPNAKGGERCYVVNGAMIGGFAVVAWPSAVGSSGVMTFIVNQDGVVYERYLGPSTDRIARAMTTFDPAPGWRRVD